MELRSLGANVAALRGHNSSLVMRQILASPGLSRTEIAGRVGLTDAAVSRITRDLIEAGLVREGDEVPAEPGQRGRRHVQLAPNGNGALFIAVSLTVSDRRVSIVDLAGRRRAEAMLPAELPTDYAALIDRVAAAIRHLLGKTRLLKTRVLGLAVATAGAVDPASGKVAASSLAVLEGRDLTADLSGRVGVPAIVETIGNTFGLAEAHRAMREGSAAMAGPSLVVHVAFGLGVSVMLDGQLIRTGGDERIAGHVPVPGGTARCVCGAHGCLMAEAGGYGILRRLANVPPEAQSLGWEDMDADALKDAVAQSGATDSRVGSVMEEAGRLLGNRLFDIGSAVTPRRVLLGGPLAAAVPFVAGVRAGLGAAHARTGSAAPTLRVSDIDYLHATELLAIEEFALLRPAILGVSAVA